MGKIGIMRKAGDSEVYGKNNHYSHHVTVITGDA